MYRLITLINATDQVQQLKKRKKKYMPDNKCKCNGNSTLKLPLKSCGKASDNYST